MEPDGPDDQRVDRGDSGARRRAARAEINGRRVNEAIESGLGRREGTAVFVCECGHTGCSATVELSIGEYEDVRTGFERFLLVPGHEMDGVDEVLERHPEYVTVAKRGEARGMARRTDPRAEDGDGGR